MLATFSLRRIPAALLLAGFTASVLAGPQDGNVVAGSAQIRSNGTQTDIIQTTPRAVIDWRRFDIGAGESVNFRQPDAAAMTLNRVTGDQASQIHGALNANGQVVLVNPNGVLFGAAARVDAAGLIVTTASLATSDFMAGQLRFAESAPTGASIVNRGTISVRDGGLAAFVAPHVRNDGLIYARLGRVILASGSRFTLDLAGDGLLELALRESDLAGLRDIEGKPVRALIENTGNIVTAGGRTLVVTPDIARNLVDNAINLGGVVRADSIAAGPAGEIILQAKNGNVDLAGVLQASGGTLRVMQDRETLAIGAGNAETIGAALRAGTNVAIESSGRISVSDARIDGRGGAAGSASGSLALTGASIGLANDLLTQDAAIRLTATAGNIEVSRAAAPLAGDRFWPLVFAGNGAIGLTAARDVTIAHLVTRGDVTVESLGGNVRLIAPLGADLDGSYALRSLSVRALAKPDTRDAGNVSELYDVTVAAGGKIDIHASRNIQLFAPLGAGRAGLNAARSGTDGRTLGLNSDRLGTGNLAFNTFYWSTTTAANSRARHNGPGSNPARDDGRWADLTRTTKEAGSPTVGAPPGPTQALVAPPAVALAQTGDALLIAPPGANVPAPLPDILPGALAEAPPDAARTAPAGRIVLAALPGDGAESTESDEEGYSASRGVASIADVGRAATTQPPKDVFAVNEHVVELNQCPTALPIPSAAIENPYFRTSAFGRPLALTCR